MRDGDKSFVIPIIGWLIVVPPNILETSGRMKANRLLKVLEGKCLWNMLDTGTSVCYILNCGFQVTQERRGIKRKLDLEKMESHLTEE